MKIGKHIVAARKSLNKSQEDVSAAADKSTNQYGKYERDKASPTVDTLAKIAAFLKVKPSELLAAAEAEEERLEMLGKVTDGIPAWGNGYFDPVEVELPFVEEWDGTWPPTDAPQMWKVRRRFLYHKDCLITMVKESDTAMRPYLLGGDAMIIDPGVKRPRSLAMVLVRIGREVLLRRFIRAGGEKAFVPLNPRFERNTATGKEEILGQIVGLFGRKHSSSMEIGL